MTKIEDKSIFLKNKYIEVPPVITIEIDTKADLSDLPESSSYYTKKTDQLLENGVQKIIWVFSATQKVMVAEKGEKWTIDNWTEDVSVLDKIYLNIANLLAEF
ncbi:MAG: hypothetical protein AAF960_27865 [Bacteroidota bacterium]